MQHAAGAPGRKPCVRYGYTPMGRGKEHTALILTVYSFFSDILSPCPANWKQKENGGQRGHKKQTRTSRDILRSIPIQGSPSVNGISGWLRSGTGNNRILRTRPHSLPALIPKVKLGCLPCPVLSCPGHGKGPGPEAGSGEPLGST